MTPTTPSEIPPNRRRNDVLREILDEMIQHVRGIAQRAREMSADEVEYAQQRLEWLADEVWRAVLDHDDEADKK
jgi:hypothetical protein